MKKLVFLLFVLVATTATVSAQSLEQVKKEYQETKYESPATLITSDDFVILMLSHGDEAYLDMNFLMHNGEIFHVNTWAQGRDDYKIKTEGGCYALMFSSQGVRLVSLEKSLELFFWKSWGCDIIAGAKEVSYEKL